MCCCLSSPVWADPPVRTAAEQLGYTEELLHNLPAHHQPRAPNPDFQAHASSPAPGPSLDQDFLTPRMYQKGESAELLPYLVGLHKKNSRSEKVTRKLALTCLKLGQPREALFWFIQTYFRDRNDFAALWNCAALSYRLGDYQAASKYLKEYSLRDPNSVWGQIAREFQDSGRFGSSELSSAFGRKLSRGGVISGATGKSGPSLMIVGGKELATPESSNFADSIESGNPKNSEGKEKTRGIEAKAAARKVPLSRSLPQKTSIDRAEIEPFPPASAASGIPPASPAKEPPPAIGSHTPNS